MKEGPRCPTMRDVARAAGVSRFTATKVIHEQPTSSAVREAVTAVIDRLGYVSPPPRESQGSFLAIREKNQTSKAAGLPSKDGSVEKKRSESLRAFYAAHPDVAVAIGKKGKKTLEERKRRHAVAVLGSEPNSVLHKLLVVDRLSVSSVVRIINDPSVTEGTVKGWVRLYEISLKRGRKRDGQDQVYSSTVVL